MRRLLPARRAMRGSHTREDDRLAVFVRGATVGAFVGAAIAGSATWQRIRRRLAAGRAGRTADEAAGLAGVAAGSPGSGPAGPPPRDGGPGRT